MVGGSAATYGDVSGRDKGILLPMVIMTNNERYRVAMGTTLMMVTTTTMVGSDDDDDGHGRR